MDRRCKYASKPCYNVRSLKENGNLHLLCDFHRDKANNAQRRWYTRKSMGAVNIKKSHAETAITIKEEKPRNVKRQRQRKITAQAGGMLSKVVVQAAPRKRGRITFRDASITAVTLSSKPAPSQATSVPTFSPVIFAVPSTLPLLFEAYQTPLSWDALAFQVPVYGLADPVKDELNWPVHGSVSSPNDTSLMSLFDKIDGDDDYLEFAGTGFCLGI